MRFAGTLGSVGLGYTDSKEVNGVPAQLVGDTYLPSAGLEVRDTGKGKGWYEVWQNGSYVGYLRPGGKNGQFKPEGTPVVWPSPTARATPEPINLSKAPEPSIPAAQAQKNPTVPAGLQERIPVVQTAGPSPGAGSGGTNIVELPAASNLQPLTDAPTAPDTPVQEAGFSWPMMLLLGGVAAGFLFKGKKRGRR